MINKIKSLLEIKPELDEIMKKVDLNRSSVDDMTKVFSELRQQSVNFREEQKEIIQELRKNLEEVKGIKKELADEIYDFRLVKKDLQKKILDKFSEELDKNLKIRIEELSKQTEEYKEMQEQIKEIVSKTVELSKNIEHLNTISSKIKAKDFEMEKFAKQLLEDDKEKLELLRKIDTLERLCAQFKRRN